MKLTPEDHHRYFSVCTIKKETAVLFLLQEYFDEDDLQQISIYQKMPRPEERREIELLFF